jgi:site-specific DNA recombinase
MITPVTAAVYARLSLDRTGDAVSVDRQLQDCRDLAARRGWTVADQHVFEDRSRSAWQRSRKRPGWDALLKAIERGEIGAVIVWHGDRLARQPWDMETLIRLVEDRGLLIASPSGERDLGNADDRFIIRIEVAAQCRESDSTARRVRRAREEEAKAGKRHGFEPYGWRSAVEGEVVREIVRRLLAGVSLRTIKADLNERGLRTPRGGQWTETQVRQIARRASNAGLRTHRGVVVGKGEWPPLVTEDEYDRIVRLLSEPARKTTTGASRKWLLSGIATCGKCGGSMRRAKVTDKRAHIYRCERLDSSLLAEPLEDFVLELIERRLAKPDAAAVHEPGGDQHEKLTLKLDDLRSRLDRLAEDYVEGILDRQQVKAAGDRLREQIADTESDLRDAERREASLVHRGVDVRALSVEQQRSLIKGLLRLTIQPSTLRGGQTRAFDYDRVAVAWI